MESKELKEKLAKVSKVEIPFTLPVLERIRLECLSFLSDRKIASKHGATLVVGPYEYPLGMTVVYHHLSVGRALFKLLKANQNLLDAFDKSRLSVREIGEEVAKLQRIYNDEAFEAAEKEGFGFDALRFSRVIDTDVDVNLLVEAIMFYEFPKNRVVPTSIPIYSQGDDIKKLRLEVKAAEAAEAAKKKADDEAKRKAAAAAKPVSASSDPVPADPMPVKPDRSSEKYQTLVGDSDFEADMAAYETVLAAWKAKASPAAGSVEPDPVDDQGDAVDVDDPEVSLDAAEGQD